LPSLLPPSQPNNCLSCTPTSWPGLGTNPCRFQSSNRASCKENPGTEPSCHRDSSGHPKVNRSSEVKTHRTRIPAQYHPRQRRASAGRSHRLRTIVVRGLSQPPPKAAQPPLFFLQVKTLQFLISSTGDQGDGDQTRHHCRSSDACEDHHNHQTPTA